ncbi:hypothetical protein JRQ81_011940 [Phrynocephalus forsythii]|uniref:Uncharacterized protein n=1 Tax=Phrynocephalus forsythii TaxID=171643 RepID=A0A9Q0X6S3_9SAUR|nr:hypothetical protein JRQ81_011940 [Phrynocephalus forsythii]
MSAPGIHRGYLRKYGGKGALFTPKSILKKGTQEGLENGKQFCVTSQTERQSCSSVVALCPCSCLSWPYVPTTDLDLEGFFAGGFLFKQWKEKFLILSVDGSLLVCPDADSPAELDLPLAAGCEAILDGSEIATSLACRWGPRGTVAWGWPFATGRACSCWPPAAKRSRELPPPELKKLATALFGRGVSPNHGPRAVNLPVGVGVMIALGPLAGRGEQWLNVLRKVKENFSQGSPSSCKLHLNSPVRKCHRKEGGGGGGGGGGGSGRGSPSCPEIREALCSPHCLRHGFPARAGVRAACILMGGAAAGPTMGYMVTSSAAGHPTEPHPPDFKELGYHPSACDSESQYEGLDYEGLDQDFDMLDFGGFAF